MATLATLTVDLLANSANFHSELKKANKASKSFGETARAAANVAGKAFAGTAAIVTASVAAITAQSLKQIDALAKTGDALGFATQELQAYRVAGELTGVSQDKLDKSLEKFVKNIGDAREGTGEAAKVLERLGLSTQQFFALTPDQQFRAVAAEIDGLGTAQEKASAAAALFGRDGIKLVNTFAAGGEAIDAARAELDAFGVSVSRIDAAQIEAANDSVFKTKTAFSGFGNQLAIQFSPIIQGVSDALRNAAKESDFFGRAAETLANFTVKAFGFMADAVNGFKIIFLGVRVAFQAVGAGVAGVIKTIFDAVALIGNIIKNGLLIPIRGALQLISQFSDTAKNAVSVIDNIIASELRTPEFVNNVFQSTVDAVGDAKEAFQEAFFAEVPSSRIEKWVDSVKSASRQAAEAAATERNAALFSGGSASSEEDDGSDPMGLDERASKLAEFSLFSQDTLQGMLDFDKATNKERTRFGIQATTELISGVAAQTKKGFEFSKKLKIANALTATYDAAINAYNAMAGIPIVGPALGVAAAAAATLFGLQQVDAIKNQSLSGGGSGRSGSGGAVGVSAVSPGITPTPTADAGSQRAAGPTANITIIGDFVDSRSFAEKVNGALKELYDDGGQVPFSVSVAS